MPSRFLYAGLYKILCKITGKVYFGQSSHVYDRLNYHKNALKKNTHRNKHLQDDYNRFGETSFTFKAILCGKQWSSEEKRLQKECCLVLKSATCYNVVDSGSQAIIIHGMAYPNKRQAASSLGIGVTTINKRLRENDPNYQLVKPKNDLVTTNFKSVKVLGNVYNSLTEASTKLGLSITTVRRKLDDPSETAYTRLHEKRINKPRKVKGAAHAKRVKILNTIYNSVSEAKPL